MIQVSVSSCAALSSDFLTDSDGSKFGYGGDGGRTRRPVLHENTSIRFQNDLGGGIFVCRVDFGPSD